MALYVKGKKIESLYYNGKKIESLWYKGKKIYSSHLAAGRVIWSGHKAFLSSASSRTGTGYDASLIAKGQNVPLSAPLSKLSKGIAINLSSDNAKWLAQIDTVSLDKFQELLSNPAKYNLKQNVQISKTDILSGNWIMYQNLTAILMGVNANKIYVRSLDDNTLQFKAEGSDNNGLESQSTTVGYQAGSMGLIIDSITAY